MTAPANPARLDYLDAVRAFALLLGIVFHASLSFMPIFIGWAVMDISTGAAVPGFMLVSHSFRMELFFLIAGFFSHMTFHRKGASTFLKSRFTRITIPFVVGWFILYPLIISGWHMGAASLRGDVDIRAGLAGGFNSLSALPQGIFTSTHLWFLYYLMLITALALALRLFVRSIPTLNQTLTTAADNTVAWLSRSPFAIPALATPTAACLWFMTFWGMDTPDKSLVPHLPVLLVYGGCFSLGWLLHRNPPQIESMARLTAPRWILGVGSVVVTLWLSSFQMNPGHPQFTAARIGFNLSYALMMWSLVFLTIGVFKKLCSKPIPAIRYVADASYWLYLIHLPIVVWLQVAVAELPYHWTLKLTAVSLTAIGGSLVLYDLLVRPTFLGKILNGRRKARALFRPRPAAQPVTPAC